MTDLDALIVGAGFSGLYMLHSLRQQGFRVHCVEAAPSVGGTWYWNRYPGARCDIPSIEYSYSFSPELQQDWRWTERYAAQPEILRYLNHVADRFDLRRDITLGHRVAAAAWDAAAHHWTITFNSGAKTTARHLIMATGALSVPKLPDWPGIEDFEGELVHTGHWRDDVELGGKRVGLVGTGSSGIQAVPLIAAEAAELTLFVRTPSFAVPASNRPLSVEDQDALMPELSALREVARQSPLGWFTGPRPGLALADSEIDRTRRYEEQWQAGTTGLLLAYEDLLVDEAANATAAEFARARIAATVKDPARARAVTPTGYPVGARRLCSEIGFYDTLNRENVHLVDLKAHPVTRVTAHAIETASGSHPIDILVLATGFNAMTGALTAIDIRGQHGTSVAEDWQDGPRSYLGLAIAGFPNLFTITGPGSPSVLSNVVVSIEQHVEWITDCLVHMRDHGQTVIDADPAAEVEWMAHVDAIAHMTLFPRADSWYQGRTRDGRRVFMPYVGGVGAYRQKCTEVAAAGYQGFHLA